MRRDRVAVALLAVLAVGALGLGASAIDAFDVGSSDGDADGRAVAPATPQDPDGTGGAIGWLAPIGGVVLVLGLLGAALLVLDAMTPRVALIIGLTAVTGLLVALFLPQATPPPGATNATTPTPADASGSTPTATPASASGASPPPGVVLGLFAAVVIVGGFAIYHFTRAPPSATDESPARADDAAALGRAAGRAADRIDAADLENGVYRAWHEMTDVLDVANPRTTTPAEFADRAVAAGLDEADVATLTDLFREVRYGDTALTPERERQAREALRRIEAEYADGDATDAETEGTE